ncbi:MAG TPA: hypothetical protein VKX17_28545 [Planctomycetota bacterium]|nr:hypothetical protein [Planctomycetota bacterium]
MSRQHLKSVCWFMLAAGFGGSLTFALLCLQYGPPGPIEMSVYWWPVCTLLLSAVSAGTLIKCHRAAPESFGGHWHLSLVDLIAISFFAALCMAAYRAVWPRSFLPSGVSVALTLAAGFTFCLLFAARKGHSRSHVKIAFAAGLLCKSLGVIAVGTLVSISIVIVCYDNFFALCGYIDEALFFGHDAGISLSILNWPLRIGLLCFPLGYALSGLARLFEN